MGLTNTTHHSEPNRPARTANAVVGWRFAQWNRPMSAGGALREILDLRPGICQSLPAWFCWRRSSGSWQGPRTCVPGSVRARQNGDRVIRGGRHQSRRRTACRTSALVEGTITSRPAAETIRSFEIDGPGAGRPPDASRRYLFVGSLAGSLAGAFRRPRTPGGPFAHAADQPSPRRRPVGGVLETFPSSSSPADPSVGLGLVSVPQPQGTPRTLSLEFIAARATGPRGFHTAIRTDIRIHPWTIRIRSADPYRSIPRSDLRISDPDRSVSQSLTCNARRAPAEATLHRNESATTYVATAKQRWQL